MRIVFATILFAAMTTVANAGCSGSGSYHTCSDNSGNRYTVQKYGNQTHLNGYNAGTGSTWSQNSTRYGNTTITNGFDADGNSWNMQQRRIGNSTYTSGFDSNGNYFSQTCGVYGCQ